jgi:anti-sigma factor RsiW
VTIHEDIELLIPWYVNGTLNEAEMDRVNGHLAGCPQCAADLQREVTVAQALRTAPAGLEGLTLDRGGWQTLAARLPPPARRIRRTLPRTALVSLVLLLAAGAVVVGHQLRAPIYQTMTAPGPYDGPLVQVVFDPSTPERVIRSVILDVGGTLVAGPTAIGVYRVGLPDASDGDALVGRLRRLPSVRWVALETP